MRQRFIVSFLAVAGAFLFALAMPQSARAQFTTVTATIQDPNGIPYSGAVMNAVLVGGSGSYTLNGQPYSGKVGPVTLDSTGKFTAQFGDVTLISPGSPQWQITVTMAPGIALPFGTGPQQFTYTSSGTTISGSSPVSLTSALNALAPKLTNFAGTGTGTIAGTVSAFHIPYASAANTLGDIAGSAVTGATGAIALTAGADTTTPLAINSHSGTQSATMLDVNNQSGGTPVAPVTVRGTGFGSFTPAAETALVNLQQDSHSASNFGLVMTNRQAVGSSATLSDLHAGVNDNGTSFMCGGNAVGDGSGNFGCIEYADNTGTNGVTVTAPAGAAPMVPFAVKQTVGETGDTVDLKNSSNVVLAGSDSTASPFVQVNSKKDYLPYGEINAALPVYGGVIGDGRFSFAATFTNGSSSVTCPLADCNFINASIANGGDVGKSCSGFTAPTYGTLVLPSGCTITAVNSTTNVTVSVTANASAAGTATQTFYYGSDQTAAVTTAFSALHALSRCGAIRFPPGYITIAGNGSTSPYGTQPTTCNSGSNIDGAGEDIGGTGYEGTHFVFLPHFGNVTFITNSGSNGPIHLHDLRFTGMGWQAYSATLIAMGQDSTATNLRFSGIGNNTTTLVFGPTSTGFCSGTNLYLEYTGPLEVQAGGGNCNFFNLFLNSELKIDSGSTVTDFGGVEGQPQTGFSGLIDNSHGGTYRCFGNYTPTANTTAVNLRVGGGSTTYLNNCKIGNTLSSQYGIFWDASGGTVNSTNYSIISGGTNGALNNVSNNTPAIFNDDGTTTFNGSITNFTGQSNSVYNYSAHGIGNVSKTAQVAAIIATTVVTTGGTTALYHVHLSVECTTTSASATVTPSILYTDTSNTVQTVTGTAATCTSLGASSNTSQDVTFRAKNATNIQYQTTIANTPTYDVSAMVEQLSVN